MRSLHASLNGTTELFASVLPVILKRSWFRYALFYSGSEYMVAGHEDWKTGRPVVNTKSLVKPWRSSLGRKFLHLLRQDCGHGWGKGESRGQK